MRNDTQYKRFADLNKTIGSLPQIFVNRFFTLLLIAPLVKLILMIFFRIEVKGVEKIGSPSKALFASQHFFEWDPILTFSACLWPQRLIRPDLMPYLTAAPGFWGSSRLLRAAAWFFCIIWFIPGREPEEGCLGTIVRLMQTRKKMSAIVFPTGPIGRAKNYRVRYGIGWIARQCPDVPIFPVKVFGIQELRLKEVVTFRRPKIQIQIEDPFFGREFLESSNDLNLHRELESSVVSHLAQVWEKTL